jgi:Uma2 family endonuclease
MTQENITMSVTIAKWTLDDYHCMIDVGLLASRQVELLHGEIVEMSPEGPEHAYLGDETARYLRGLLSDRAIVREGRPVTLPNDSEPEPDLAIVRSRGSVYRQHHPYAEDIFWLIEFSNASLAKDLDVKRTAYAAAMIQEYWVVNLKNRQIHIFRDPGDGDYRSSTTVTDAEITPLAFPDVVVAVQRILGNTPE